MTAAGIVLMCAFDLLGRSPDRFPPIEILTQPPPHASAGVEGFTDRAKGVVYLIASAPAFRAAQSAQVSPASCRAMDSLKIVASIIAHEEWHMINGPDEEGAYLTQLMTLQLLGLGPESVPYKCVKRAMQVVLAARRSLYSASPD